MWDSETTLSTLYTLVIFFCKIYLIVFYRSILNKIIVLSSSRQFLSNSYKTYTLLIDILKTQYYQYFFILFAQVHNITFFLF